VVLALGTRLNPFSTLPGYGIDYWPKEAKIIQVDINPDRIGLTKKSRRDRRRCGKVATALLDRSRRGRGDKGRDARREDRQTKSAWAQQLTSMDHEEDDPGTTWNERARADKPDWMSPRMAWRAIQSALPKRGDHFRRYRQQLRHRQRLPDFRGRAQIPRARAVRSLRLRPALHRRRQDRLPRCAGRRLSPATAPSASR
jgi:thiamine pyrophosphate-dependent acetolactate synthase large subunit-like protein